MQKAGRTLGNLAVLLVSFALTSWVLPQLPLRGGEHPQSLRTPDYPDPGADAFFVSDGGDELSHIVLYHDIGASIEQARKADILLFGNSRAQMGWEERVFVEGAARGGLKVFNIAVGHADKTRFALDLIRRHDLRPRVVIASGGPFVFTEGVSPWAAEVMAMNAWDARKYFWERSAAWWIGSRLHRLLPRLDCFATGPQGHSILYRSAADGWWRNAMEPPGHFPVTVQPERASYSFTLPLARELKQELDDRGALLVLTMVPYKDTRSGHLAYLSGELGVPYILPSFDGLKTSDGSHLDRDSASRISKEFWQEFVALGAVRDKLGNL